ncbi:MAG: DUF3284 domain-containing protein [Lactimicrobium sp.]|jgi:hypothetical protein|uniref:DUF3284 domain-containing protein n=1 Tax=Lactimicrobium sp. TaxID=2563780 RepID=UPI002F3609F5
MKLIRTWDISSDAFFDYLEKKVSAEIKECTGRTIKPSSFSGFKYCKKNPSSGPDTNITIEKYVRGSIYQVTARSLQQTITNTFETKGEDGKLEVTMTSVISEYDRKKDAMSPLKRTFYSFAWHSRMARVMGNMYEDLLREKNHVPEPKPIPGTKGMKHLSKKLSGHVDA